MGDELRIMLPGGSRYAKLSYTIARQLPPKKSNPALRRIFIACKKIGLLVIPHKKSPRRLRGLCIGRSSD